MSQPCFFIALIHLTGDAYSRLMRSQTLEPLANAIAHIVTDGRSDVVVFKYLEKEQALFVHYFFLLSRTARRHARCVTRPIGDTEYRQTSGQTLPALHVLFSQCNRKCRDSFLLCQYVLSYLYMHFQHTL